MLEQYYNKETQTLKLPWDFDEELCDLPLNTKVIIFEKDHSRFQYSKFNQPVDNLPNSITHLTFGWNFKKTVNNLPHSITHLSFKDYFNQPVNNLPNSITHLTFGYYFNQLVDNLPSSLQEINFNNGSNSKKDILSIIKKVPFGCRIFKYYQEIFLQ